MEHLREQIPLKFLDKGLLLVLLYGIVAFLHGECLLSALLHFSIIERLIVLLVIVLCFHVIKFAIDVLLQVLLLNPLPLISVELDGVESETDLFLGVLPILAHRVQADHILDLLRLEGFRLDLLEVKRG